MTDNFLLYYYTENFRTAHKIGTFATISAIAQYEVAKAQHQHLNGIVTTVENDHMSIRSSEKFRAVLSVEFCRF